MQGNLIEPLVSIIIPCYNVGSYLEETLESVLGQHFQEFEVIAVNDGSTDDTLEILERYAMKDKRLQVLNQANTYCVIARQNAIKHAKGKYLVCLDGDDKIDSDYLQKCVDRAEADNLTIVYSDVQVFGRRNEKWDLPEFNVKRFLLSNCIYITALIRKADFDAVGGFDTQLTMFEDWDLFIALVKNGASIHRIKEPLFHYRLRDEKSSVTNSASKEKQSNNLFKIYSKHYDFYQKNGIYFQELFTARVKRIEYYEKPWRRLVYKYFKTKRYHELYSG